MKTVEEYRMDLHQIPELGRCEFETKKYILSQLKDLNAEIYEPTPTSVVAYFNAHREKTICFRADMDGLSIEETNPDWYVSKHPHLMHACGHDGHMAMLLKIADWTSRHLDDIAYNLVCLFQPSEEEQAGALDIIDSQILDKLHVKEIYGMHLWPNLEEGKLYANAFNFLPLSLELNVHFTGKSVHAANREAGIDALKIASEWLLEAYNLSKRINKPHLLSFGSIEASGPRNAVLATATLYGTFRTFEQEIQDQLLKKLEELSHSLEQTTGIKIQIEIAGKYPMVHNDESLYQKWKKHLNILPCPKIFWQAEDFGCYTQKYPCLFMLLGIGDKTQLHTSDFNFDMKILSNGVEAYQKILMHHKRV